MIQLPRGQTLALSETRDTILCRARARVRKRKKYILLTFLHISDTHISSDPAYKMPASADELPHPNRGTEALLTAIQRLPFAFDFILHTGDVCADPTEADCLCARELLLRFPAPMFLLAGNHDSGALLRQVLHDGERLHVLGDSQRAIKGCRLVTLDTNGEGDVHAPVMERGRIEALKNRLDAADSPTIVAAHHPLIRTGVPWIDDEMRLQNGEEIQRLLARRRQRIAGFFHGHIHQAMDSYADGLLHVSCQSTWSNLAGYPGLTRPEADSRTPGGFNLVMLRGGTTFVRRYSLPRLR